MTEKLHPGAVTIELGDDEVTLIPTGRVVEKLERAYGDLMSVYEGLGRLRSKVFVDVIAFATGVKLSDREALEKEVFAAGYVNLVAPLTRFVTILGNGGQPPKGAEDEDEREGGAAKKA